MATLLRFRSAAAVSPFPPFPGEDGEEIHLAAVRERADPALLSEGEGARAVDGERATERA